MIRKTMLAVAAVLATAMQVEAHPRHRHYPGPRFGLTIGPVVPPPVVIAPPVYPYPAYGYPVYAQPVYAPPPVYAPLGFGMRTRNFSFFFGQ